VAPGVTGSTPVGRPSFFGMLPQDWLLVTLLNWGTPEIGTELPGAYRMWCWLWTGCSPRSLSANDSYASSARVNRFERRFLL
jgi:hypothetical protein